MQVSDRQQPEPIDRAPRAAHELGAMSGYRADIQALRGFAVLAVVLFHTGWLMPGGFVGVDIFFVISGYVIGRQLVAGFLAENRLSYATFYARRARRLLPALSATLAGVVLLAPLLAPLGARSTTKHTAVSADFFAANLYLFRQVGGYFAPAVTTNPLLHTWSLSVEEQFYFAIPSLLLAAWAIGARRRRPLAALRATVVGILAASLVLSLSLSYANTGSSLRFAFFSPFTRAWEFVAGLLLVVIPLRWIPRSTACIVLLIAGIALTVIPVFAYSDTTRFPGAAAVVPVLGAALVILAGSGLRHRRRSGFLVPLVWCGDLSYSWYLWHWPFIVFTAAFFTRSGTFPLVVAAALSLAPAWLSARYLERRFRLSPTTQGRRTLRLVAVCMAVPLVAVALSYPIETLVNRRLDSVASAFNVGLNEIHAERRRGCHLREPLDDATVAKCTWGDPNAEHSIVLLGDSNAGHFSEALIRAVHGSKDTNVRIVTAIACPFLDAEMVRSDDKNLGPECLDYAEQSMAYLERHPADIVMIANANDSTVLPVLGPIIDPVTGEASSDSQKVEAFTASLTRVLTRLRDTGARPVVLMTVPKPYSWDPRNCSSLAAIVDSAKCIPPSFGISERVRMANDAEREAARRSGTEAWDFADLICPQDHCEGLRDGDLVWSDASHISVATSRRLAPTFQACIDESTPRPAACPAAGEKPRS